MPTRLLRSAAREMASRLDRAFVEAVITPSVRARRRDPAESLPHDERVFRLSMIQSFYGQPQFLERGGPLFSRPEPIVPKESLVRRLGQGEVVDLSWESGFDPIWRNEAVAERLTALVAEGALGEVDPVRLERALRDVADPQHGLGHFSEKYLNVDQNRTAYARWFRHTRGPRPAVVLIHGHMGGLMAVEERLWPVQKLFEGGMDVILPLLPFHGARRDPRRGLRPPDFPGSDPRRTIEGFRQVVHDFSGLADYLLAGRVTSLGLGGMSLGGHAAALIGTVDPRLDFMMLLVPLACIADFAHVHGRLVGNSMERAQQAQALRDAQWAISPFARPPLISGSRVLVVEGSADRVTGPSHANQLAVHFNGRSAAFDGGHLLQFGRAKAFEPLWRMLKRQGLWRG